MRTLVATWSVPILAAAAALGPTGCAEDERAAGDVPAADDGRDVVDHGGGEADDGSGDAPGEDADLDETPGAEDGGDVPDGPDPCAPIPGASYVSLSTEGPVTDRPPPEHADLNVKLRGWEPVGGTLGLVDIAGPTDLLAPKLNAMFADDRVPAFVRNYAVHAWDWGTNSRAGLITDWEVTMAGFATAPGEIVEVPRSGYLIGEGLQARVLYADDDSITLKFTREDNVVRGYTVHVVGVCVEPGLRALYDSDDASGRGVLPALAADQPLGRARSTEILVSVRDSGAFMDPRSRKDWW